MRFSISSTRSVIRALRPQEDHSHDPRSSCDSVPRRRRRTSGQGCQLRESSRRRRSRGTRGSVRRSGRRRTDLPGRHRLHVGSWHDARRRKSYCRAGFHSSDRRRWSAHGRGRRSSAACRCRQGQRQHRGDCAPGTAQGTEERFGSQCIVLSVDARTVPQGQPDTPSGWEVTTHGGKRGTGIDAVEWAERGAELGVGRSCSTRWTPTAPKRASTF